METTDETLRVKVRQIVSALAADLSLADPNTPEITLSRVRHYLDRLLRLTEVE